MAETQRAFTINPQFNQCWNHLLQVHSATDAGETVNINIFQRPKFRTDSDYLDWLDSLLNMMKIGSRNGWVSMHLDSSGRPMWLSIERSVLEANK